jgi:hypothetical protein
MASIRCFQCQKRGHTAGKCPNREQSCENEIEKYIQVRDDQERKQRDGMNNLPQVEQEPASDKNANEKKKGEMEIIDMAVVDEEEEVEDAFKEKDAHDKDVDMDNDQEEEDPTTNWESGLQTSIHAHIEIATHMKIDLPKEMAIASSDVSQKKIETRKEMLALTSSKPQKRKLPITPRTLPEDIKKSTRSTTILEEPIIIRTAAKALPSTTPTKKIL